MLGRTFGFSLLVVLAVGSGCQSWLVSSRQPTVEVALDPALTAVPWTSLHPKDDDSDFDFVVVTDRTGEHREGVFREAIKKVNLVRPAFVLSVGDLIEGYTEDPDELRAQWDEIADMVSPLAMPFFYAAGNHDMSNAVMSHFWRDRFGPTYYSFVYKDVLFVVLNSELFGMVSDPRQSVPGPETQEEQMSWLQAVLEANRDRRYTFVIVHQPLWDRHRQHPDWTKAEEWLGRRPYLVLAGHTHSYTKHVRHDRRYITLATTGGGSGLRGIDHGEFDHFMLISMRNDGPVLANLFLEGVHDENVRTAETRRRLGELERAIRVVSTPPVDSNFEEGQVRFEVTNSGIEAVRLQASFESMGNLRIEEGAIDLEIAPGGTRQFAVAVSAATGSQDLRDADIPRALWRLRGSSEEGRSLMVERDAWLIPRARFFVLPAADKIRLDGDLGEWGRLSYGSGATQQSGTQASFRFDVAYDDEYLYLGVDVQDSTPVHTEKLTAREQDAVQINLDARPDPQRSSSGQGYFAAIMDGTMSQLLVDWFTPVEPQFDSLISRWLPAPPGGMRQASKRTETGYAVEIAVPATWLDERQGKPWQKIRIELSVQDYAEEGGHPRFRFFRPGRFDRGGVLPVPGSATFERVEDSRGPKG
jgi:hypothetical protein